MTFAIMHASGFGRVTAILPGAWLPSPRLPPGETSAFAEGLRRCAAVLRTTAACCAYPRLRVP
jgi:hypothetical protein